MIGEEREGEREGREREREREGERKRDEERENIENILRSLKKFILTTDIHVSRL